MKGEGHMELNFAEFQAHQQELKLCSLGTRLDIFYQINVSLMLRLLSDLETLSLEYTTAPPSGIVSRLKAIKEYLPLDKIQALIDKMLANSTESEFIE
jgi:hypothetical protein